MARHRSSKEIAAALGIAKSSVDTYCNRARSKLGVDDRYTAARLLAAREPCLDTPAVAAASEAVATAGPAAAWGPLPGGRWAVGVGAAVALALAAGSLLSGLAALEKMKPLDWPPEAAASQASETRTDGAS